MEQFENVRSENKLHELVAAGMDHESKRIRSKINIFIPVSFSDYHDTDYCGYRASHMWLECLYNPHLKKMSNKRWSRIGKDTNAVESEHSANNRNCGINRSVLGAINA